MSYTVFIRSIDGTAVTLHGSAISFVNNETYGPAGNFNVASEDDPDGSPDVVLVNLANVLAVTVEAKDD